jgi:hypothetical protein
VLEAQPPAGRQPYIVESSLTVLRGDRLRRLRDTNCAMLAPGVESWTDYSNKAAVGRASGVEKVDKVAEHFTRLAEHVPYLQANFMFGLDTDAGDEPVELTKRFMDRTPFAWPTINIPVPFGGTPLHDELAAQGRILTSMPFSFYYAPYLVTTLKAFASPGGRYSWGPGVPAAWARSAHGEVSPWALVDLVDRVDDGGVRVDRRRNDRGVRRVGDPVGQARGGAGLGGRVHGIRLRGDHRLMVVAVVSRGPPDRGHRVAGEAGGGGRLGR